MEGGVLVWSISRCRRSRGLGVVVKGVYQEGAFVRMTWERFLKRGGGVFGAFYRARGVEDCECVRELVRLYVRLLSVVGYRKISNNSPHVLCRRKFPTSEEGRKSQRKRSCSAPLRVIKKQKNTRPYQRRQLQRHST